MQKKVVCSPKIMLPVHLTTLCHNPEDSDTDPFSGCNSSVIYG